METSTLTTLTALEKVLNIPLLLEEILLNLSHTDLLVNAQRVNHAFHTLISTSPLLQRRLFFQSSSTTTTTGKSLTKFEFNPLLKPFHEWFESTSRIPPWETLAPYIWQSSPQIRLAFAYKEASWRRMFPTHPAVLVLRVEKNISSMGGQFLQLGRKEFGDGLRMGPLYDFVYQKVIPITRFYIDWEGLKTGNGDEDWYPGNEESEDKDQDRNGKRGESVNDREIRLVLRHVVQCCPRMNDGRLFKSEGFKEVDIKLGDYIRKQS